MFRIRRIYDDSIAVDRQAVAQAQEILRLQFSALREEDIRKLPRQLRNPLKYRFRSILFVSDDERGRVRAFAVLQHAPDLRFCFLDFISVDPRLTAGGAGGALYQRLREEARALDSLGIFFECLPDDPALCVDQTDLAQNRARLRFYERYGARPVIGTAYETPLRPGDDCPPYLVVDPLGREPRLNKKDARGIVRAILERKYGSRCPRGYVDMVVESFNDDPVRLRPPRYTRKAPPAVPLRIPPDQQILLVVNDRHQIHHVRERGYVEAPVRIMSIMEGIRDTGLFRLARPRRCPERLLRSVHDPAYVSFLRRVCANVQQGKSVYPYVFPIRNATRPPRDLPVRAGYYCIDTFTPLNGNAYLAARRAVDCAYTVACEALSGHRLGYALVRPPGHHAERRSFGGFCYFNSAAVAAQHLSRHGRVAVLDVDYHHGNGTQHIFLERADVLTVSLHGHPRFAYPYFNGFRDETGEGAGRGFNVNYPLPERLDGEGYRKTLRLALGRVARFRPRFLVVALGLDTARRDPTGTWNLNPGDFAWNGRLIGELSVPTVVVQEGGYRNRDLGANARGFFVGLWEGLHGRPLPGPEPVPGVPGRSGGSWNRPGTVD